MAPSHYALLGLTALVAGLVGILVFAVLRFAAAARDSRRHLVENKTETAFVTAALHEAVVKLKAQEREMSARAEASERLNTEIVESLTSGLIVVGADGTVCIMNPAARRLLAKNDGLGRVYNGVLPRELADVVRECLTSVSAIVRRKLTVQRTDLGPQHLGVSVSPLWHAKGGADGAICLFTDLTPAVEMEEQLRLKESLAQVGELTAGIAHEFRNGLATIHGYAHLLDLHALPAEFHPHVRGIREETDDLGEVVTNFLNFARPAQLTLTRIGLRAIVERAAEEFAAETKSRGGSVTIRGDLPDIEGDEVLLRQAFSNLLRNAIEACVDASTVPLITVDGRLEGSHVRVTVDDNGPGVPVADRERVFRPFVSTKGRGTGLGLALVQKIIVTHNGRIQVGSCGAGGASFQITLPVSSAL